MDPVNPKALKGKFKDRQDKDIDNDGDVDSSDEYLHKRRQAVSKAIGKIKEQAKGLWANIHAKRKRGEAPAKPGDKDYPSDDAIQRARNEEYGPGHIGSIQRMLDRERKYKKPTQAEIDADRKKDQGNKSRPSMTSKSVSDKQYAGYKTKLKTEEVDLDEAKTDIYHKHMLKALGKSRLPKNHQYTSAIATNGDFVVHDGGGRVVGRIPKGEHNLKEAAPKIKSDFIKTQREKDRAHDAAMGRTATGRKKTMTSTQRSLASMRKEEVELDEVSQALAHKVAKARQAQASDLRQKAVDEPDMMKAFAHTKAANKAEKKAGQSYNRLMKKEEVELDEAMTAAHKKLAHDVHKQLKRDEPMGLAAGIKLKANHKTLRSKYGADWRKKAEISEEMEQLDEIQISWRHKTQKYHTIKHPDGSHWGVFDHGSYGTKGHEIRKIRDSEGKPIKAADSRKNHWKGYKSGIGSPSDAAKEWAKKHGGTITNHKVKEDVSEAKDGDGANIVRDRAFKGKSLLGKTPVPYKPANPSGPHYSTGKKSYADLAKQNAKKSKMEEVTPKLPADEKPLRKKLAHFRHQE